MATGFFGGVAEGMSDAEKNKLQRDQLAQELGLRTRALDLTATGQQNEMKRHTDDVGLRTRALGIQAQGQANAIARQKLTDADAAIADTMTTVSETIAAGLAANKDPELLAKAVQPLVESAKRIAQAAGRDPSVLDAKTSAMMARPRGIEAATAGGTAKGVSAVAEEAAITAAGGETGRIKDPKDRISAEGALRDDYLKQAKDFITIRDAKNRIDTIQETGAGDMGLIFQYMKILDPGSTVREGEYATAANSGGVPASVVSTYNKLIGGGVLSPKVRKEVKEQAEHFYQAGARQHERLTGTFRDIAKRQKLNVDNVIVDLSPARKTAAERVGDGFAANIPAPPDGFQIVR